MLGKQSKAKCLRKQPEFSRLDKSRPYFLRGLTLLVFLLTGAAIFYINTHVQVVGIGYEIDQALAKKQNLIEENKKLSLEIARLRSPTRIEAEAREKLNLTVPNPRQWVHLSQLPGSDQLFAKAAEMPSPSPSPSPTPGSGSKAMKKAVPESAPPRQKTTSARSVEKSEKTEKAEKKVIVARIIGDTPAKQSSPGSKPAAKSLEKVPEKSESKQVAKNLAKPKETVPAVLLDSMP